MINASSTPGSAPPRITCTVSAFVVHAAGPVGAFEELAGGLLGAVELGGGGLVAGGADEAGADGNGIEAVAELGAALLLGPLPAPPEVQAVRVSPATAATSRAASARLTGRCADRWSTAGSWAWSRRSTAAATRAGSTPTFR